MCVIISVKILWAMEPEAPMGVVNFVSSESGAYVKWRENSSQDFLPSNKKQWRGDSKKTKLIGLKKSFALILSKGSEMKFWQIANEDEGAEMTKLEWHIWAQQL